MWFHLYKHSWNDKTIETEKSLVVASGWIWGRVQIYKGVRKEQSVPWLWHWLYKSRHGIKLNRITHTQICKCKHMWNIEKVCSLVNIYRCQFPGADTVLKLYKTTPRRKAWWRVHRTVSTIFATSWVPNILNFLKVNFSEIQYMPDIQWILVSLFLNLKFIILQWKRPTHSNTGGQIPKQGSKT